MEAMYLGSWYEGDQVSSSNTCEEGHGMMSLQQRLVHCVANIEPQGGPPESEWLFLSVLTQPLKGARQGTYCPPPLRSWRE